MALAVSGCLLNLGFSTIFVWCLALSKKKTKLGGEKLKKNTFMLKAHFLLKIFETCNVQQYHCGAVALAINFTLWSGTSL